MSTKIDDNLHPLLINLLTQIEAEQPQVFDNLDLLRSIARNEFRRLENQLDKKIVRKNELAEFNEMVVQQAKRDFPHMTEAHIRELVDESI